MNNSQSTVEDTGWRRIWRIASDTATDSARRTHYYYKARRQLLKHPWLRWLGRVVYRYHRANLSSTEAANHQYTIFMRNRALMEALGDLVEKQEWTGGQEGNETISLLSLGCSRGAELYSAVWVVRSARPELDVNAIGVDISDEAIATARAGRYEAESITICGEDGGSPGPTSDERASIFVRDGEHLQVHPSIQEDVQWLCADVSNPDELERVQSADIVFCKSMLCHMPDEKAATSLSNACRLVRPKGYLFVTGVNLEVKSRVLRETGFRPIPLRVEEIYHDPAHHRPLRRWPFSHCGREPMQRGRSDWLMRYASIFQAPDSRA